MKTKSIFLFLFLALLCACSSDEEPVTVAQQPRSAVELSVSASDFVTYGDAPDTRAADNGATITFENGDRVGVIVLEGSELKGNNLPYVYNGTSWSFDANENSGKSVYYHDNKATNVTYIVYYPYSADADNVTSIDGERGLKSKFTPKEDQQSEDNYRASDLMTWTSGSGNPQKKLSATLTHAYNSISILPEVHYTLDDGKSTNFGSPSLAISDVNFIMDDKIFYPYAAEDGSYRYILSSSFTGSVRCFFTLGDETYGKELTVPSSPTPAPVNTRYSSTQKISAGAYSLDKARIGDFYCSAENTDGTTTGYLIPGEATALPEGTDCLGIVYWLGNIAGDNYNLLDSKLSSGTHGLVVSLWNLADPDNGNPDMYWTYGSYEFVKDQLSNAWGNDMPSGYNFQAADKMQGYINTIALQKYNDYVVNYTGERTDYGQTSQKRIKPIYALENFKKLHSAPSNSSDWYWPSHRELEYVCWGQGYDSETKGRDMLDGQLGKVGGTTLGSAYYWSSTEYNRFPYSDYAYYVYFSSGYEGIYYKYSGAYRVRPLLAF